MRRPGLGIGVDLVALGAASLVEVGRLRDGWLGARLMPLVIGFALVALGTAHLAAPPSSAPPSSDGTAPGRAGLMLALLVLYVVGLPWLGFLPATAIFVLVVLRWRGAYSWPATIAVTVAIAGASHLIFLRWLACRCRRVRWASEPAGWRSLDFCCTDSAWRSRRNTFSSP